MTLKEQRPESEATKQIITKYRHKKKIRDEVSLATQN